MEVRKEGDYDQAHDRGGDVEQSLGGPSGSVHVGPADSDHGEPANLGIIR